MGDDQMDEISPNLINIAQQMGLELNSEQIQQIQKMMEEHYQGEEFEDEYDEAEED